jgi:peroxin-1
MLSRKPGVTSSPAELRLVPSLRNCLLNLPSSLTTALLSSNTVTQNVVVELTYSQLSPSGAGSKQNPSSRQKSIFLGWTGMQSQTKLAPIVGRDALAGSRGINSRQEHEVPTVEMDAALGRLLGVRDGMKVWMFEHLRRSTHTLIARIVGWCGVALGSARGSYC